MFLSFFNSLARSRYLSLFHILLISLQDSKVHISTSYFLLLIIIRSGRLVEIRWSVCISKSHRSLCVSFSRIDSGLCIYHLFVWSNFNFLHDSQWITLSTQFCQVLYSFCTNLLHSLIMWLIVSSLSPHNLHVLYFLRIIIIIITYLCDTCFRSSNPLYAIEMLVACWISLQKEFQRFLADSNWLHF